MGIGFPALNVGAMGAVAGPEVGLASGVLNTARQLGAAIGVAILVATFGGVLHAHMSWFADEKIEDAVDDWEIPGPLAGQVIQSTLHDYTGGTSDRFEPEPGFDEEIIRQTAGSAREGFAWAFRQAALLILSVLPLLGALKPHARPGARRVHGEDAGRAAGRAGARARAAGAAGGRRRRRCPRRSPRTAGDLGRGPGSDRPSRPGHAPAPVGSPREPALHQASTRPPTRSATPARCRARARARAAPRRGPRPR